MGERTERRGEGAGRLIATAPLEGSFLARPALYDGLALARKLAETAGGDGQLAFSRSIALAAVRAYWDTVQAKYQERWPLPELPSSVVFESAREPAVSIAEKIGVIGASLNANEASYLIGVLYTALMPQKHRADHGAYYTPPALCERLLDMASEAGTDWRTVRVLDPACGGGAFLSPLAQRIARHLGDCSPKIALKNIVHRLCGFELDPFAAWMSQVFLECTLGDLCRAAGRRMPWVVRVCDSLQQEGSSSFDLVVGNPPYGRTTLPPDLRVKYQRSLYGHANLYGLFTDLALRFTKPGGVIAYVTPTSFLAGEYFKALRGLLAREAPPVSIDFVADRKGVFADVLQEALLAAYRRGGRPIAGQVHSLSQGAESTICVVSTGAFRVPTLADQPWLIPRSKAQATLVRKVERMFWRLVDYGYKVSTGPLVWNRHKQSLRDKPGKKRYPLVWAESVRSNGTFEFRAEKRNHQPFFEPNEDERWVVTSFPCVLLQRTTAKEQARRLIAAELPAEFVEKHGGVVVENHLNMIRPNEGTPVVSSAALAALLQTNIVDELFRCISGSVAVSAFELEALPLPSLKSMQEIESLVSRGRPSFEIEAAVGAIYERAGS